MKSTKVGPAFIVGPSGAPVTLMIPLKACSSGSYPGRSRNGPARPNAPMSQ